MYMLPLSIFYVSFSQTLYCSSFLILLPTLGRCRLIHQHNEFDLNEGHSLELKKKCFSTQLGCSIYEPNREKELL